MSVRVAPPLLAVGDAAPGQAQPSQNVAFDGNAIQGNIFAMASVAGSGLTLRDNTIANNALGVFDVGSGGSRIGTAGHGNAFLDNGLALFMANTDPDPDQLDQARVNPDDTKDSTRATMLSPTDGTFGVNAVDALTTAGAYEGPMAKFGGPPDSRPTAPTRRPRPARA